MSTVALAVMDASASALPGKMEIKTN